MNQAKSKGGAGHLQVAQLAAAETKEGGLLEMRLFAEVVFHALSKDEVLKE